MICDDHALHFADSIASLLHAGVSVPRALFEAPLWMHEATTHTLRAHTAALAVGAAVGDVVDALGRLNRLLPPILDVLTQASIDGIPVADHLALVVSEVRNQRRRVHEQRLARLAVRLTLPVVTCVLPAFIVLGVIPLIAAVMPSLSVQGAP